MAGNLTYQGGYANWQSTNCQTPQQPVFSNGGANTLSANVNAYNDYTRNVQNFLNCINQEARQDLNQAESQVFSQLGQINQVWQADLQRNAQILNSKRGR